MPSGNGAEVIEVWDLERPNLFASIRGHGTTGNAMCSFVLPPTDGTISLLIGYDDGTVQAFSISSAGQVEMVFRLKLYPQTVTCLDYHQPSDSLLVGGPDAQLTMVRNICCQKQREVFRVSTNNEGFSECVFTPSGGLFITGGWDGKYLAIFPDFMIHHVE